MLAIDPGTRRVGLAISDAEQRIAQPLAPVSAHPLPTLAARLTEVARSRSATRLVVGLPRRLDGTSGPEAVRARELAAELRAASGLPVELVDERLTTAQAERGLRELRVSRQRRRQVVDGAAAALILQAYLEAAGRGR